MNLKANRYHILVDRCTSKPKIGCSENEDCVPIKDGIKRCLCKDQLHRAPDGSCSKNAIMLKMTKMTETYGRGKGPILPDFTTGKPRSKAKTESMTGPIALYTSISKKVDSTFPNIEQRPAEPQTIISRWVYGIFGAVATVMLAAVGMGMYICYRKTHAINKRRFSTREFELQNANEYSDVFHSVLHNKFSIDSSNSFGANSAANTTPLYMNDIGNSVSLVFTINVCSFMWCGLNV